MSRLFISHSSQNDDWAIALKDWLIREGWSRPDDIFLDLDPDRGIAAGERWAHALEDAATRCEAVLFLVSEAWLTSKWCIDEYQLANKLNKKLFALLIEEAIRLDRLPGGLNGQWQIVHLQGLPAERFLTVHPRTQHQSPVQLGEAGLRSLKRGLEKAGLGPETFELQKDSGGPFGYRAPYRGLEALEAEDAAVFFGRGADIVRGIDVLRGLAASKPPRLLVILGASGAGKSSFVRAGLWPRLNRDDGQWIPLKVIRAGRGGALEGGEGLLAALEDVHRRFALRVSRAELRQRLGTPDEFILLLRELREAAARRTLLLQPPYPLPVLCLDQAEEICGAEAGAESDKFLRLARAAIQADEALLLVSIRSDSYGLMQSSRVLAGVAQMPLSLGPVPHGEIARIIREPAEILRQKAGPLVPVFDEPLVERLQAEIEGETDALPLLAFVLQRLMREHAGANTIGLSELEHTGGVAAALELEANAALADAGFGPDKTQQREALRRLFIPRLARIDRESKVPQRRVARQSDLPSDLLPLARALTQRRLLVVKLAAHLQGEMDPGTATLEVAHEALLRRWPTLAELLAQDRDALLLLDGVLLAAADWQNADASRRADFLTHRGSRLSDAQALAFRGDDWRREIAPAREYLAACASRETAERQMSEAALQREQAQVLRTRKFQRRAGLALAMLFAAVMLALANVLWQSYGTEQREAAIFASAAQTAYRQNASCDSELRLALAGLPATRGAFPFSFRSRELQDDLAFFGNHDACYFQLALAGHEQSVTGAAFSSDAARIVTTSGDGTARVWDAKTGTLIATLSGHSDWVYLPRFSPDGSLIATSSRDGTVRIWDAQTYAAVAVLRVSSEWDRPSSTRFSPDSKRVLTAYPIPKLWDARTGALVAKFEGHGGVAWSAEFSPDGTRIITTSSDKSARVWDLATGNAVLVLTGYGGAFSPDGNLILTSLGGSTHIWDAISGAEIATIAGDRGKFSPAGERAMTAVNDQTVRLWDARTGASLATISAGSDISDVAFSPDGSSIVTAQDNKVAALWDAATGALLAKFVGHRDKVITAAFSPDGGRIVSGSVDKTARLWSTKRATVLVTLTGHTDQVLSATFSPGGRIAATASVDNTARLWDVERGNLIAMLSGHGGPVRSIRFSSDGSRVLTASMDKTTRIWNVRTGAALAVLRGYTASFSPDVSRVVTADSDNIARVWNTKTGAELGTLVGHTQAIRDVDFSPDGNLIVTASRDGSVRIWDAKTYASLASVKHDDASACFAAFTSDGLRLITVGSDSRPRMWDTKTGKLLRIVKDIRDDAGCSFWASSPDGNRVISSGRSCAYLSDLQQEKLVATLCVDKPFTGAAFSSDGALIVTAGVNGNTRLWDAVTGAPLSWMILEEGLFSGGYLMPSGSNAAFSPNGSLIISVSRDGTARIWQVDPLVRMLPDRRADSVCRERLIGAQSFSDEEMKDPILRSRDDLRNPCDRAGPLSFEYYWQRAAGLLTTVRGAFGK